MYRADGFIIINNGQTITNAEFSLGGSMMVEFSSSPSDIIWIITDTTLNSFKLMNDEYDELDFSLYECGDCYDLNESGQAKYKQLCMIIDRGQNNGAWIDDEGLVDFIGCYCKN